MLRLLVSTLACATFLCAVDPGNHVQKSAPVDSATRLVLNADVGTIRVEPGYGKSVDVEVYFHGTPPSQAEYDRMLHDFTLDMTQQGSDIRVSGAFHDGWQPLLAFFPFFGHHTICRNWECLEYGSWLRYVEYRVTVPEKFNADVETWSGPIFISNLKGEVNAHTSGGSLSFEGVEGQVNGSTSGGGITLTGGKGRAVMHTSGGGIKIKEAAGDVDASTSGGPISIEGNLGRVRARTSGGGIWIRDASGPIDASTSGGGVTASLVGQPKEDCRLSTSGGSIDVRLSRNIHVDLDASASGGTVWTDFPVTISGNRNPSDLHVPLNGGGPRLYLHTSGGGIAVHHAD
jgi:hypothetical protein